MGKVLGVGGILPKLQAAVDAGCKEVILPSENARDVELTPQYIKEKLKINFASSIEDVLNIALLDIKFSLPVPTQDGDSGAAGGNTTASDVQMDGRRTDRRW